MILFFAGRVELIKSTISAMHLFWSSSFILPKSCIEEIEKLIRCFLGGCFDDRKRLKTVAWDAICKPTEKGGLGIKSVEASAAAALLKQVWAIVSKRKSLWTDWAYMKYIKNRSF